MWNKLRKNLIEKKVNTQELMEMLKTLPDDLLTNNAVISLESLFKEEVVILDKEQEEDIKKTIDIHMSLSGKDFKYTYEVNNYVIISPIILNYDELNEIIDHYNRNMMEFELSTGKKIGI